MNRPGRIWQYSLNSFCTFFTLYGKVSATCRAGVIFAAVVMLFEVGRNGLFFTDKIKFANFSHLVQFCFLAKSVLLCWVIILKQDNASIFSTVLLYFSHSSLGREPQMSETKLMILFARVGMLQVPSAVPHYFIHQKPASFAPLQPIKSISNEPWYQNRTSSSHILAKCPTCELLEASGLIMLGPNHTWCKIRICATVE